MTGARDLSRGGLLAGAGVRSPPPPSAAHGRATSNHRTRRLRESDLVHLKPVLEHWIKDCDTGEPVPEEVEEDLARMRDAIPSPAPSGYVVVVDQDDIPSGVMGLKSLDFEVEQDRHLLGWRTGDNPCELINAYVDPRARGEGLGRLLVHGLIALAREHSYDEILVSSGRRYREIGWTFYDKVFGERRGVHPERYGKGRDAPVWGMKLPRA